MIVYVVLSLPSVLCILIFIVFQKMGTNTREMCVASQKINVHFVDEPAKIVILTSIFGETLLRERESISF